MLQFKQMERRLQLLEKAFSELIQLATIKEVVVTDVAGKKEAKAICVLDDEALETAPLPWLTRRAGDSIEWWAPEAGEQVVILNIPGRHENAVILPAIYSSAFPAPETNIEMRKLHMRDGTEFVHDIENNTITLTTPCEVTVTTDKATVNTKDTAINVEGKADVTVTGDANIQASSAVVKTEADTTINAGANAIVKAGANVSVEAGGNVAVKAAGMATVDAAQIKLNKGTGGGVVCQAHMCSLTGAPHPQGSTTVLGPL